MRNSNASDLDVLFGGFGLKESPLDLRDKVQALVPDAVFSNAIPDCCKICEWDRLSFYEQSGLFMVFWTQNLDAYKMEKLRLLMKTAGCISLYCYPYMHGRRHSAAARGGVYQL